MKLREERDAVIEAFIAETLELKNHFDEGLITDLEMFRKIYLECHTTYTELSKCSECGTQDTGHHKEDYAGNFCPDCNPDKRQFTVTTMFLVPETKVCLTHELWKCDGIFGQDLEDLEKLELFETITITHEDLPRVVVTRIL